jgi:hypothetical protein
MTKRLLLLLALIGLFAGTATAGTIGFQTGGSIGQGAFSSLVKEAGVGLAFKNNAPPHPLGLTGFDAGVELSAVDINPDSTYWKNAFGGSAPSYLVLPKLRVRKGLPFGFDIGAMYSNAGNTNIQLYGVEVAKAILEGSVATPAVGIRATYTKLAGLDDLDLQTAGIDVTVGKGFLFLTPYAGIGYLWINGKATGNLQTLANQLSSATNGQPLAEEKIWQPRIFAGLEVKPLPLVRFVGEVEYALRPIYSVKAAVGF